MKQLFKNRVKQMLKGCVEIDHPGYGYAKEVRPHQSAIRGTIREVINTLERIGFILSLYLLLR